MNEKEIGEIRRRMRKDRSNMTAVFGCYVSGSGEIITELRNSFATMPENEAEKYFGLMKRTLSGTVGKNLIDISFRTAQVMGSPEHKLLMELRRTGLNDEQLRQQLYRKIIDTVRMENGYLILLGYERYDVPFRGKDGHEDSEEVYDYISCAVCPVKQTKTALHYVAQEHCFRDGGGMQTVAAPELGFLFPAFDDRRTNIYGALYYTHDIQHGWPEFVDSVFQVQPPKPAGEQKESFQALLADALQEDCSLEVVQQVHDQLCSMIELHKESKMPEPLLVSKDDLRQVLDACGVSQEHSARFSVAYEQAFGVDCGLHPKNIIDHRKFALETPDVSIKVNPARSDLIETRIIGGVKYILICADENVEVNGVNIHIEGEKATV